MLYPCKINHIRNIKLLPLLLSNPCTKTWMKGDWDFRISDLVKTLMEQIFNPFGEFQWSPEGPVSQIHSPRLRAGSPGIFSDLLRSVQMLKREWGVESNGKLPHLSIPNKLQPGLLSLWWKTCLWAELHLCSLNLRWRTCPCAEYSGDNDYEHKMLFL